MANLDCPVCLGTFPGRYGPCPACEKRRAVAQLGSGVDLHHPWGRH